MAMAMMAVLMGLMAMLGAMPMLMTLGAMILGLNVAPTNLGIGQPPPPAIGPLGMHVAPTTTNLGMVALIGLAMMTLGLLTRRSHLPQPMTLGLLARRSHLPLPMTLGLLARRSHLPLPLPSSHLLPRLAMLTCQHPARHAAVSLSSQSGFSALAATAVCFDCVTNLMSCWSNAAGAHGTAGSHLLAVVLPSILPRRVGAMHLRVLVSCCTGY